MNTPSPPLAHSEWPQQELEYLQRCPVCGHTEREKLHADLQDRLFHIGLGKWTLYSCGDCGSAYLDPRPDAASIGKAYLNYSTHDDAGNRSEISSENGTIRTLVKAMFNGYRNDQWGMSMVPSNRWGSWIVARLPVLRNMVQQQMRHLPNQPPKPGARLLDVGSGNGEYLALAKAAGWSVEGVDFDPKAIEAARHKGIEVHLCGLLHLPAYIGTFDRITCSHVLEHVHDPKAWLAAMHRRLEPGGTLWLQTPNVKSVGHSLYGPWWRGLEPPRHLSLFNLGTLTGLLAELNFTVQFKKLPMLSAMYVYAVSEASRRGDVNAAYLPIRRGLNPKFLWPALKQAFILERAEFLTVVAVRNVSKK